MGTFDDWSDTFRSVLTGPKEHFRSERRRDGFGYPLKFALISLVLTGVVNAARAGLFGVSRYGQALPFGSNALVALSVLVISPIVAVVGLLLWSGVVHIFASLLGGEEGYSDTLSVFEYATAVSPVTALLSLVPLAGGLLGFLLSIYALYIQITGLMEFQDMSQWRAAGAVILPGIILLGIFLALMLAFAATMAGLMGTMPTGPVQ